MILKEGVGLFKVRKPKSFNLPTRYYDENKERLNQRVKEVEQELGKSEGENVRRQMNFRQKVDSEWKRKELTRARNMANIRLMVIIAVLLIAFVYFFNNIDGLIADIENTVTN